MRCPVCECPAERLFFRDGSLDYWRCDSCAATFLDPGRLPSAETERGHYRLHHNEPDDEGYRQFPARLAPPPLERLPPAQHGLTYGCARPALRLHQLHRGGRAFPRSGGGVRATGSHVET